MILLHGEKVNLRALEPEDLDFLYTTENDTNFWQVSNTQVPFSKFVLKQYLENAHQDIYEAKQLRLIIEESKTNTAIGMIDLFDFNPQHRRAGIGILVHKKFQNFGFASDALSIFIPYCFKILNLHQIFANIISNNQQSIKLFSNFNFKKIGIKKDWLFIDGVYNDEFIFQLINE
ncbi:MAG: GNAT family N-acetyltransferase [Flavobacteriaceae bacterium]